MKIRMLLLGATLALSTSACATTGAFDTSQPMTPTVATVAASSMLMPSRAHVFVRDAIVQSPAEAAAITHAAVIAAPDRSSVITAAALSAAPQESGDIKSAARQASWAKPLRTRGRALTWTEVQQIVDAAIR